MKEISSMLLRGTLQPYGIKRSCSGMLSKESWIHFSNYYILSSFLLLFLLNFKQGAAKSHSNSYLEIDIFVFATLVYWHLAIMELFLSKAIWRSIKNHLGLSVKHLQLLGKAECFTFSKSSNNLIDLKYFISNRLGFLCVRYFLFYVILHDKIAICWLLVCQVAKKQVFNILSSR